jgi:hypothetical protein
LSSWFQINVIDMVIGVFTAWETSMKLVWTRVWDALVKGGKAAINSVIDVINSFTSAVAEAINFIIGVANNTFGKIPGVSWTVIPEVKFGTIPHLAMGGVIPPNAAFAAVLGEQSAGKNIEAPEDLIRQIVREETANQQQGIVVRFEGSLGALVRELKPVIDRENIRVGTNFIVGGIVT